VNEQLDHLCSLKFASDELAYLRGLRFIKSDFVDFLRIFHFQREFIAARAIGHIVAVLLALLSEPSNRPESIASIVGVWFVKAKLRVDSPAVPLDNDLFSTIFGQNNQ